MVKLNIPSEFRDWFWMMYTALEVMIVINKCKSDILQVKRGLESVVSGILTPDNQLHKVKVFADDLKLFLADLKEIKDCYKVIEQFEGISGMKMHRDPERGKCQALLFEKHWIIWIGQNGCR